MRSKFNEAITDERNQQDVVLWLIGIGVVAIISLAAGNLIAGHPVDIGAVGTALAEIIGLGSVGYGAKRLGEKYGPAQPCDPS